MRTFATRLERFVRASHGATENLLVKTICANFFGHPPAPAEADFASPRLDRSRLNV
jgi:hypothetical protein